MRFLSVIYDWSDPGLEGNYFPPTVAPVLQELAQLDLTVVTMVRTGDLLIANMTQRISEVRVWKGDPSTTSPMGKRDGTSHSRRDDVSARADFTLAVLECLGWGVPSADDETIGRAFLRHTACAVSVGPISLPTYRPFLNDMAAKPGYLGTCSWEWENPIVRQLLWHDLSPRYLVGPGANVHIIPDPYLPLDEQWTTPEGDVTSGLPGVAALGWASPKHLDSIPPLPSMNALSKDGLRLLALYERITRKTRREQLAHDLMEVREELLSSVEREFTFSANVPDADDVRVEQAKLTQYALDPDHPKGGSKAAFFNKVLGITARDWRYLAGELVAALQTAKAQRIRLTSHGLQYHVDITVKGLNGKEARVRTAWIVEGDAPPRLTTLHPINSLQ